jgi:hypothetical protein
MFGNRSSSAGRALSLLGIARLAAAAVALLALGGAARAQVQPIVNGYQLAGTIQPDAWLTSSIECGVIRCDVKNVITSRSIDAFVNVVWLDVNGKPLVSADNAYLWNFWEPGFFGGYLEATSWTKGAFGSAWLMPTPIIEVGTADFTGSIGILQPCGSFICNDAEYYTWPPSPFSTTPGGNRVAAGAAFVAQAATPLLGLTGALEVIGVDSAMPGDVTSGPSVRLFEFSSTVELVGTDYVYHYAVTNLTESTAEFDWADAGLAGELGANGTATRSFVSALGPTVLSTVPTGLFKQTDPFVVQAAFSGELGMLAPVPEPASQTLFALGLGGLLVALGLRRGNSCRKSLFAFREGI